MRYNIKQQNQVRQGPSMSWIDEHRRVWRGVILAGVLAAIVGPWAFDVVSVPPEYPCSAPYVRVNDDFCGIPLPGTRILSGVFGGLITATGMLVTRTMPFEEWVRICVMCLFLSLLVLPVAVTLLLILREDRRRWRVLNFASWGTGAGLGLVTKVFVGSMRIEAILMHPAGIKGRTPDGKNTQLYEWDVVESAGRIGIVFWNSSIAAWYVRHPVLYYEDKIYTTSR